MPLANAIADLRRENKELRARLAEAEELLRAIRAGEADAVALDTPAGQRVYPLKGAEQPYREMIETVGEGAIAAAPEVRGRRAAEQQLRESEEKFRTVAEAAQDAIIMVDSTDTILYWNASAARMLGYSAGETVGRKLHDWIAPARYREAAEAGLRGFATTGKGGAIGTTLELAALRKDGVEIPVEISLTAVQTDGEWRGIGILRDISERKAAEMALRQSEEKFRSIVETSSDWIWEIDASDTYTYASPSITTLLGYQPEEMVGKRYFDFMPAPEAARVTAVFQPIKDARKPFALLPNVLTRKDGTEVFVETSAVPIFADDGSFKGYRGIDRDVTERERAKQKQAFDAAILAAVQNTSPDGVLLVDRQALILSYNERFVEMFAISPELIAAKADARVLETVAARAADPAAFLARVLELYRLESEIGREELALKDGRTIDRYTAPVKRDDGTYLGRVWFFRDITAAKKAETTLRLSEAQLSNALQMARAGHWSYDVARDLFSFNDNLYRIFGVTAEDAGGYTMSAAEYSRRFCHPDDAHVVAEETAKAIATTDPTYTGALEHRIIRKGGDVGYIAVRYFVVKDRDGKTVGTYGVNQDITERKRAEQALLEKDARYRNLFESTSDAFMLLDPASRKFTSANPSSVTLFGAKDETELLSRNPLDLSPERQPDGRTSVEAAQELVTNVLRAGFAKCEWMLRRLDGTEFPADVLLTRIVQGGKTLVYMTARDISERKASEMALRFSEAQLSNALRIARAAPWSYDLVNDRFTFTDGFYGVFGVTAEEVGGYTMNAAEYSSRFCHPADVPLIATEIAKAIESSDPAFADEFQHRSIFKGGAVGYVAIRFFIIKDKAGRTIGANGVIQNITEQKLAQQAILDREARYRNLFESTHEAIVLLDPASGRFTSANSSAVALFGAQNEAELCSASPRDLSPEKQADGIASEIKARDMIATAMRAGFHTFEWSHRRFDGTEFPADILLTRVVQGGETQIYATARDITERKRAEQAIRESEAQFRSLVEQEIAGIFIVGADGVVTYVNDGFSRMHGYLPDEFIGRPLLDFIPQPERQEVARHFAAQMAGKPISNLMTTAIQRKDGSRVDVLAHGAVSTYRGKPALFGIAIDITALKQAERKTAESELRLRTVLDTATDGIAMLDAKTRKFMFANRAFREMLGYSAEELSTLGLEDVHPPEVIAQTQKGFDQNLKEKIGGISDLPMKRKDGSIFIVEIHGSPMKYDGRAYLVAVFHDVTERNRTEQTLLRLNRTLATLSACNATMVHATCEADLLRDMCKIAVERGGYRMAWIGFAEHDAARTVKPVTWAGEGADYLTQADIRWADVAHGRGPTGEAIRTGVAQISQDIMADKRMTPWKGEAKRHGFISSATFPLKDVTGVFGALTIYSTEAGAFDHNEVALLTELASDVSYGIRTLRDRTERETAVRQWRDSIEATVSAIANTVEMRDPYTAGHQRRVAQLAVAMGRELGMSEDHIHGLFLAGIVHDVGKIQVPAEILNKPGKLSKVEFQLIQQHAQAGYDVIKDIEFPWPIAQMVLQHHERLDGSGYPNGLKGDEILAEAKILAIADVVEAMTSHRPYRAALGLDKALEEIEQGKGRLYDPASADACIRVFRDKSFAFS